MTQAQLRDKIQSLIVEYSAPAEAQTIPAKAWQQLAQMADKAGVDTPLSLLSELQQGGLPELIIDYIKSQSNPPGWANEWGETVVLSPPDPITTTICRMTVAGNEIRLVLPEQRDDFGKIVKRFDYQWNSMYWWRSYKGGVADKAAEMGVVLLRAGFCIIPPNSHIRHKITELDYSPTKLRKVLKVIEGKYKGWLALWWARGEAGCYSEATKITGSRYRYSKPNVVVPPENYAEVEDFAQQNGFWISPSAQELIAQSEAVMANAWIVDLDKAEVQKPSVERLPKLIVPDEVLVDNDLLED